MNSLESFLQRLYKAFNKREIASVLAIMDENVKWANGMEGGFVYGRENVGEYWKKQFEVINPQLEPFRFTIEDKNRAVVFCGKLLKI